jgi:predicted RND superfamily exporter protein
MALAALYPALQIRTDFNLENFFPEQDPAIDDYEYLEKEFGRDDNIVMVGFHSDSLFTREVLTDLKAITASAKSIENITKVRSLFSATEIRNNNNKLTFDPYLYPDSLFQDNFAATGQKIASDPLAEGYLLNQTGDVTAFYLEIDTDGNNYSTREDIIAHLQQILAPYQLKYDFNISGIPYYRNQYVKYLNNEMVFYVIISSILVIVLLWSLYRSATGVIFPILIVWLTILLTLGIMQLTGGYFEVMTSTLAPILLCVGIADSVHMISKYDDATAHGLSRPESIKEMITTLGSATFLTSITTAIGFGTLVTSEIIPMKRFGTYTAAGVMIAFAVTIFLLPSLLSTMKINRIFKDRSTVVFRLIQAFLKKANRLNRTHFRKITLGTVFLTLCISGGIYFLKINGKVFDELSEDTAPIQQARFFSENLTPPYPIEFIIDTKNENGITNPDFVQRLENFTNYLESQEEVNRVISFNTLMKEMHQTMAPDKASRNTIPTSEPLLSQYLLLFEMNDQEALQRVADFSYQKVRVAAQVYDVGSYRINQLRENFNQYLNTNFPDAEITTTGSTILSANLNSKIVNSLFKSIGLAFVLISILMAFLFRNIRMVFISLIPNILPLVITAGFMGYSGIDIKSSTAVIFSIAFGIAVDDSIHFLARLRVEMKKGKSLEEALPLTTLQTGKAIIITSLILLAGFGSLLTSVFSSTVYMGLLVGITIFTALLADLFLLPSLFYWIQPKLTFGENASEQFAKSDREPDSPAVWHQP